MVDETYAATGGNGNGAEHALAEMRALSSAIIERVAWARAMGMTHGGKRDTWGVFGYDDVISAQQYRDRYERGGIAKSIVEAYPTAVWRGDGEVIENDEADENTAFEDEWWALNDQLRVWSTLQRAHVLAELGNFSAILIGAAGTLDTELPMGKPGGVLYLRPLSGGVVTSGGQGRRSEVSTVSVESIVVKDYDENIRSRRFGLPVSYTLKMPGFANKELAQPVHWSRIVHVPAPGFLDNEVFGPPYLQDVWNYLLDLDKVEGGGSEAFWLRANKVRQIDIDKKMTLQPDPKKAQEELDFLKDQVEQLDHQLSRTIRTRGVNINDLGSDVADFSHPQDAILTLIAGTKRIPKRILTGSEMGSLASDQDRDNWNDQVKDVRTGYAHPVILRPFIERLIKYGYMTKPAQWQPRWPESGAMSDVEKLAAAKTMVELNDHGEVIMLGDEVREFLGREPLTPEQKQEIQDQKQLPVDEAQQVDQLEAALRKGGTLSIAVRP